MPRVLRIDSGLNDVDLSDYEKYVSWSPGLPYLNLAPGQEHYKLLAYLAKQLPPGSLVSDCGTLFGCSALALAANDFINVVTYDMQDHIPAKVEHSIWQLPNVIPVNGSCMSEVGSIAHSDLVMLDVDPHDGKQETAMLVQLELHSFRGILICDDIHLNDEMREFWKGAQNCFREKLERKPAYKCIDLTKFGHWSGTGAIVFAPDVLDIEVML